MKLTLLTALFFAVGSTASAVPSDSLKVSHLLEEVSFLSEKDNKILFLAKGFQGTPYLGGTLETFPFEQLVVRTDSVDCTTFVEYILAMNVANTASHLTISEEAVRTPSISLYQQFKKALTTIRYRNGILDGYVSRLHYFSDWILDNEQKGIVREVTKESPYAVRKVDLNFMTTHASLYPKLAHSAEAVARMKDIEGKWKGFQMAYIPKERLNGTKDELKIQDGDILTIVTNIKGLDVVHVGFACWVQNRLHLLHASSAKKHVLLDPIPLYDYSLNKKSHLGIRVVRILDKIPVTTIHGLN